MAQKKIDIRELKETLSSHLEDIKRGADLLITDQGQPMARLVPVDLRGKIQQMLDSGMASWSGQKPSVEIPRVPRQDSRMVSDLLLADRR